MTVSLFPIWFLDFVSNIGLIVISVYLMFTVRRLRALRPHAPLWMYLHWQVIALGVFALSHSVGHVVRRILLFQGREGLWNVISPYTGSINSLSFVVVGVLSFLYKNLESAGERYGTLEDAKRELEVSLTKLKLSSIQMERDAHEIFQKNKELSALNNIAMAVSKSLEMDKVLNSIIKEVREFLGVSFLGIYLVEKDKAVLKVSEGLSGEFLGGMAVRSIEEPWLKGPVFAGRPSFASERPEDNAHRMDEAMKREGLQAWAAVPLMAKGAVVGVLAVGSSKYDGISPHQIDTLTTIGGYAGVVIENARLYEELKQKVEDLEHFRKFSVGREMRIIELKDKMKELEKGGKPPA